MRLVPSMQHWMTLPYNRASFSQILDSRRPKIYHRTKALTLMLIAMAGSDGLTQGRMFFPTRRLRGRGVTR